MKVNSISKAIIVAVSENGCIGKDNKLPWHFSSDLAWFKELTVGQTVIMGRKTFESIGKPLPDRRNIVITTTKLTVDNQSDIFLSNSLDVCWRYLEHNPDVGKVFLIGGVSIFKEALEIVDTIYLTKIPGSYEGDAFFPSWPLEDYGWVAEERIDRPNDDGLEFWRYAQHDRTTS